MWAVGCGVSLLWRGLAYNLSQPLDTQAKPCYDAHALMRRYDLISSLCEKMESMGWGPYQADHEDANGQFEINWDFDDALRTADRMVWIEQEPIRISLYPRDGE